ncbi:MAG TPA: hypothetical protein VGO16_10930 [Pseudonocardiaceae bacterium]|jgi:hypothetical protein|nr:hypothetical protein [Pseudonocardiaceae bacterium]
MNDDTGSHRRWWRRAVTAIGLGVATVVVFAPPALGHPVFSNDGPGFPNPNGGTGASSQTPPYPAGSRPTLNMFLPFEQDGVIFKGAENTTVTVQVTIPVGWTSPACGAASTSPSAGYRQLGTVVPHWACTIETVSGHQVLHWTGPQVSPAQTHDDSAQFFTFQVTMPSPATQTSYGAPGGPEGVHVKQVYADGATSLWRPPNSTQAGEVANGIVRTVSKSTAPPPKPAGPPPPEQEHGGPSLPGATPPAATPNGAKPNGPPPQHGDGGSTPSSTGQPPPTGPTTAVGPSSEGSSAPTPIEPSPGVDPQASSVVEQLTKQGTDATGDGVGWQVVVGAVLAAVLAVGAVIAVVKRRRRPS